MEKTKTAKKTNKRRVISALSWTLGPTLIAGSIGGAIYFVIKNSQKVQKEYWSKDAFLETAKKIKINDVLIRPLSAQLLVQNFNKQKYQADTAVKAYLDSHPELSDPEAKLTKKQLEKLKENMPKQFDPNEFLAPRLENDRNFNGIKFLKLKYSDIKLSDEPNKVDITFEITLNYDYARGDFESQKIKGSSKSKYYFKNTQTITILTNEEKWNQGTQFYSNQEALLKEAGNIIHKYKNNFESELFRNEMFEWFRNSITKENAYPDIYPADKFSIEPYIEDNQPAVVWNPSKSLNTLSFTYQYVNKENRNISSEGRKKIFTITNV